VDALPPFGSLADALPPLFVGGCFAAVSSASSLAEALLPRVTWPFHRYGCFAIVGILASSLADALPLAGSLVDALPPFGSLTDSLPSLLLDGLLCGRPFRCCIAGTVVGLGYRGQSLFLFFVSMFISDYSLLS
jgi:hypothetical protein